MRVGKKLSYSIFIVYIDTQVPIAIGRGAHGPDERGLERLFNITSNYRTVRQVPIAIGISSAIVI